MDFTKDFNLQTLKLTNAKGDTRDLRYVMVEINVFEDLWSNNTTCSVLINDATNLLMNFPIFGFETLLLEFQTPEKDLYSKEFRLVQITNRELVRERQQVYLLHFVTPEAITNMKTRVSKSYKGKLLSDIVTDIHATFLGGDIDAEATDEQQHVIIPNLHPAHAINWISTRAVSSGYDGASYLYYEANDGYHFVTMESRLKQDASKTYLYQVANVLQDQTLQPDFNTNVVASQKYSFDHLSDVLDNMKSGMYGNTLLTHSHVRKLWKRYTFDYPTSFDDYEHLYASNPLYSQAKNDLASPASRLKLHPTGQDDWEFHPENWLPIRISQLQQLHNTKLTITVPGDSERTVGEVVEFVLPSPEPTQDDKQINDKYHQSRYLVSALRHKIDNEKYSTTLLLVKDSTFEAYP